MYLNWRGFKVLPENIPLPLPGAYRFTRLETGEPYVGMSHNVEKRCGGHGSASPKKFKSALKEHGRAAFLCEPLFYWVEGEHDRAVLAKIEAGLIADNDAVANGYNVMAASEPGPYGEEFRKIMEATNRLKPNDPVWKANLLEGIARRSLNLTWRENQKAGVTRWVQSPEGKAVYAEAGKKRAADPEYHEALKKEQQTRRARERENEQPPSPKYKEAAARRTTEHPTWLANVTAAGRRLAVDPDWQAKNLAARRARAEREAAAKAAGLPTPGTGWHHTESAKETLREKRKRQTNVNTSGFEIGRTGLSKEERTAKANKSWDTRRARYGGSGFPEDSLNNTKQPKSPETKAKMKIASLVREAKRRAARDTKTTLLVTMDYYLNYE